jgi:hypothetical protein
LLSVGRPIVWPISYTVEKGCGGSVGKAIGYWLDDLGLIPEQKLWNYIFLYISRPDIQVYVSSYFVDMTGIIFITTKILNRENAYTLPNAEFKKMRGSLHPLLYTCLLRDS